jgi:exodeoxyribonuclease V beta subunit
MATISDQEMVADLERFASLGNGSVTVTVDPAPAGAVAAITCEAPSILPCRTFSAAIDRSWRVASFSSLVSGHKASSELPDRDIQDAPLAGQSPKPEGESIFTFPKGTKAGTLLHDILEELDFTRVDDDYYRELAWPHLEKAALESKWLEPVATMLRSVMTAGLGAERLRLCDLPATDRCAEMEFFFPLQLVTAAGAARIFSDLNVQSKSLQALAGMLNFREQQGVLLGFVDLVFSHGGRYYIIDWKSNHLGDSAQEYSQERMQLEMNRHLYPLQYLLYSVALHRYLKARMPAYSYETHFGGVFYLFVRGVDPAVPDSGVFFDRPAEELVTRLEQYFSGLAAGGAHG